MQYINLYYIIHTTICIYDTRFAVVAMPCCGVTLGRCPGHLLAQDTTAQHGPAPALCWSVLSPHTEFPDRIPTMLALRAQTQPADKGHWHQAASCEMEQGQQTTDTRDP